MRLHAKPWAEPELEASRFFIDPAEDFIGRWRELYKDPSKPLHLEIGCGKCVQIAATALDNPGVNYLAIDEVRKVLANGCRVVREAFGCDPDNLLLSWGDAMMLTDYLSTEDRISRIYISFPNPWDKRAKQHKHRLTHPRQLMLYRQILTDNGEIWFKTDDEELFETSLEYFASCGFVQTFLTRDLHEALKDPDTASRIPNYESEHEKMFTARGIPIRAVIVRMVPINENDLPAEALKRRPEKDKSDIINKYRKDMTK